MKNQKLFLVVVPFLDNGAEVALASTFVMSAPDRRAAFDAIVTAVGNPSFIFDLVGTDDGDDPDLRTINVDAVLFVELANVPGDERFATHAQVNNYTDRVLRWHTPRRHEFNASLRPGRDRTVNPETGASLPHDREHEP